MESTELTSHLRLVSLMVSDFIKKHSQFGHLREDLRSGAALKLLEVRKRFDGRDTPHFRNYLRKSIETACWNVVRTENVIQTPRKVSARRRPLFVEDRRRTQDTYAVDEVGIPEAPQEYTMAEGFRERSSAEVMAAVCQDDVDRTILELVQVPGGMRARELARTAGLRLDDVRTRVAGLLNRFRELY